MTYFVFLTIIVRKGFNFLLIQSTKLFAWENDANRELEKATPTTNNS